MKSNKKKLVIILLLVILAVFIVYTGVCILSTHEIMQKAKRVITGEEIITEISDPWYYLGFHEKNFPNATEVRGKVHRIFTWCGINRGFIYIWYSAEYLDNHGNILHKKWDYCKLIIEKQNGEWELSSFYISP